MNTLRNDEPVDHRTAATTPGAGLLALFALIWLLAMFSSARYAIGDTPAAHPVTVARAALELPQVISASLIAGIAVGLVAVNALGWRFPAALGRRVVRCATAAASGALTGLAVAAPILLGYGGMPSILVLSGAVAGAAALGGLLAGVRRSEVVAAGALGGLGVFVVIFLERAFEPRLRELLGAGDSPVAARATTGWIALVASLTAGVVAGALCYRYLRRSGPPGLRWPWYLVAGAMPGLLAVLAELVTRLGGARVFQLASAAESGTGLADYFPLARINRALVVVFVGALVAIFLFGRTRQPDGAHTAEDPPAGARAEDPAPRPRTAEDPAET